MFAAIPGANADPNAAKPAAGAPAQPVDTAALIAEGDKRAAGGDLYGAVESYAAARRAAPADRVAAGRLGIVLAEQGRYAEALPHLEDAERADPPDPAAIRSLINALLALERPMEASIRLAQALTRSPEDARLWNAAGIAADLSGDAAGAATAYHTGMAAAPDNQSLKINLALSRFAAGDQNGAAAAATAAGMSMTEVASRAGRLIAYRDRTRARATVAIRQGTGNMPDAPPMVALALPPVQVRELPAVPAPAPAVIAAAPTAIPAADPGPAPEALATTGTATDSAERAASSPPAATDADQAAAAPSTPAELITAAARIPAEATAPVPEAVAGADGVPAPAVLAAAPAVPAPAEAQADQGADRDTTPAPKEDAITATETPVSTASAATEAAAQPSSDRGMAAATPPAEPVTAWKQGGGNLVQLAAYGRASLAEAQWKKLKDEHAELLAGMEPLIQRADLGEKGVVYRLRIGAADRPAAASLCERLRGAGLDCVPIPSS